MNASDDIPQTRKWFNDVRTLFDLPETWGIEFIEAHEEYFTDAEEYEILEQIIPHVFTNGEFQFENEDYDLMRETRFAPFELLIVYLRIVELLLQTIPESESCTEVYQIASANINELESPHSPNSLPAKENFVEWCKNNSDQVTQIKEVLEGTAIMKTSGVNNPQRNEQWKIEKSGCTFVCTIVKVTRENQSEKEKRLFDPEYKINVTNILQQHENESTLSEGDTLQLVAGAFRDAEKMEN